MSEAAEKRAWRPLTADDLAAMGQEVIDLVGNTLSLEDFLRLPKPAEFVRQQQAAAQQALEQARDQAREQMRQAERKAAREAALKATITAKADLLRRMLRTKFGDLPAWAEAKLDGAAPEDFDRWSERLFSAETVDQVFV